MKHSMTIQLNKALRLDNALVNTIYDTPLLLEEKKENYEGISLDLVIGKMMNLLRMRGAEPVGPIIQYSEKRNDHIELSIMVQSDRFINNIQPPYRMEPVINIKKCLYTRFKGMEEDIQYAYQKIQVTAYEEDIKLKGSSYTIFLDSDDNGTITADIFMERADA